MPKKKKNPWIAAALNFIVWGAGYIYAGQRSGFGILIWISFLMAILAYVVSIPYIIPASYGALSDTLSLLSYLIFSFALARDAYNEAKKARR